MSNSSEQPLEFQCPKCGKRLKASPRAAGKRLNCPSCQASVKVPGSAPNASADDEWLSLDSNASASHSAPASTRTASASHAREVSPAASPRPASNKSSSQTLDASRPATPAATPVKAASSGKTTAAPTVTNSAEKPSKSIFDDDLPELAELEAPKPRTSMASILGVDNLDDLVPVAPGNKVKSGGSPAAAAKEANSNDKSSSENRAQEKSKKAAALDPNNAQYRCACPTCGTPQYVTPAKQGKTVRCPDCFADFKIPPPPPGWKPTQAATKNWSAELVQTSAAESQRDAQQARAQADDLLRKAAEDLDDSDIDKMYDDDFDTKTFLQRTFGFLYDTAALFQVLTYCVLFAIFFGLLQFCLNQASENRGYLLFAALGVPLLAIITAFPMFGAAVAILESVANGQSRVREWHGFNFFDQIGELMMFAIALAGSAVPGVLVGGMLAKAVDNPLLVVLATMLTSFVSFPVILLSMLDNESLFNPFSPDVLKSISVGYESWGTYYFKTFVANFVVFIAWTILLGGSPILAAIGGLFLPFLFFFTIQQLGVLAYDVSEHLSFVVPPEEKEAVEQVEP